MGAARALATWGKRGRFRYVGSPEAGTRLLLGRNKEFTVRAESYAALLEHFEGREVPIGASRNPPRDSLGAWLRSHVGGDVIVAYVGPILVHEGYAERVGESEVRFLHRDGAG